MEQLSVITKFLRSVDTLLMTSFVRSFFAGRSPAYSGLRPACRPSAGPMRLPLEERRGIGRCEQCVRDVQERRVK